MFKRLLRVLGSSASGNFGHGGRPGQRGGSAKMGGAETEVVHGRALDGSEKQMTLGEWNDLYRSPDKSPGGNYYIMSSPQAKTQAVTSITNRLEGKEKDLLSLATALGRFPEFDTDDPKREQWVSTSNVVNDLIKNWAVTSADHNPLALAIQKAAAAEFGSGSMQYVKYHEDAANKTFNHDSRAEFAASLLTPEVQTGIRAILRTQYEETQEFLKSKGIEKVVLYRGFTAQDTKPFLGENKTMIQNPMSSWSVSENVAMSFGTPESHQNGAVLAAEFKREDILAIPGHGMGCLDENEMVVKGGAFKASGVPVGAFDNYMKGAGQKAFDAAYSAYLKPGMRFDEAEAAGEKARKAVTAVSVHAELAKMYVNGALKENAADLPYVDAEEHNADWIDRSKDVILDDDNLKKMKKALKETDSNVPKQNSLRQVKRITVNETSPLTIPMASVVLSVIRPEMHVQGSGSSGNFGHIGRKGMRGGSAKRGDAGGGDSATIADTAETAATPPKSEREVWSDNVSSAYGDWVRVRQEKAEWDKEQSKASKAYWDAKSPSSGPIREAYERVSYGSPAFDAIHSRLEAAGNALRDSMANGPADVSYSKNNPNQTEHLTMGNTLFDPIQIVDMKTNAIDAWVLTGDNQILLQDVADEHYGRDVTADWVAIANHGIDRMALGDPRRMDYNWFTTDEDLSQPVSMAVRKAANEIQSEAGTAPAEIKAMNARFRALYNPKIDWGSPTYKEDMKKIEDEKIQIATTLQAHLRERAKEIATEEVTRTVSKRLGDYYNPTVVNRSAAEKMFMSIKEEAAATLSPKGLLLHRGVTLAEAEKRFIKNEIETKGFYDLPVPPVQSYTRQESLATQFAKYGQTGGKGLAGSKDFKPSGMVISSQVPPQDIWCHDKQPTWKGYMEKAWKEGLTFHIGGKDQKECIVGHPQSTLRLTKDNVKWI